MDYYRNILQNMFWSQEGKQPHKQIFHDMDLRLEIVRTEERSSLSKANDP